MAVGRRKRLPHQASQMSSLRLSLRSLRLCVEVVSPPTEQTAPHLRLGSRELNMANPKKRSRIWILLAILPVCGGAAFFSVRALSRTPAKIDPEKLVKEERKELRPS